MSKQSSASMDAHQMQPPKILAYFSTNAGQKEARMASTPKDPVIVRSNFDRDVQAYCTQLRTEFPKACYTIFAGWDIRWYFDEYDFERQGGLFLYTVLMTLMQENGKRVVEFCSLWAEANRSKYPDWADPALTATQLFHEQDHEQYGPAFLENARTCLLECYQKAREQRLAEVNKGMNSFLHLLTKLTSMTDIAAHGVPFQAQESSIAGAYSAHRRALPPGMVMYPLPTEQHHQKKGNMKTKGFRNVFRSSPPDHQSVPAPIYDPIYGLPIVALPTGAPVPPGLRPVHFPSHHVGHAPVLVQIHGLPNEFSPQSQVAYHTDATGDTREVQDPWHGQDSRPRHYASESVRGRRNSGSRGGAYKINHHNNSLRRSSLGQSGEGNDTGFNNGRRSHPSEDTWRRGRIFEREVQDIPPEMNNFQFLIQQNQQTSAVPATQAPATDTNPAAVSGDAPVASEPLVRLHSDSSTSTQPASSYSLQGRSYGSVKYHHPHHQGRLSTPPALASSLQVSEHFVGEDREDVFDVFVGNITHRTSDHALRAVLEQIVAVQDVSVSRGVAKFHCAFVKLFSTADLRKILPPTRLYCDGQLLDIKVSRKQLDPPYQSSQTAKSTQPSYSDAQAIRLNSENQQGEQEPRAKYSPQDVRSTLVDVSQTDAELDAKPENDNLVSTQTAFESVELVATHGDQVAFPQKENLRPATFTRHVLELSEQSSAQFLPRRKKDNVPGSRPPVALTKALSSIGEAEEPLEAQESFDNAGESDQAVTDKTSDDIVHPRSETVPQYDEEAAKPSTTEDTQESRSEIESQNLITKAPEHTKVSSSFDVSTNTTGNSEHQSIVEGTPSISTRAIYNDTVDSESSSKMNLTIRGKKPPREIDVALKPQAQASHAGMQQEAADTEVKTAQVNRDTPELNVTTSSFEERKKSITSAATATPADSAFSEGGFPTPSSLSSSEAFGPQTSVKDQAAIVDLTPLRKDISRAEKLLSELDDTNKAKLLAQEVQDCKTKLNALQEKMDAIAAAKGESKSKGTMKKNAKKTKAVKEGYATLTEEVHFLFRYKEKEESKESRELKKRGDMLKEEQRLREESKLLKEREKKVKEALEKEEERWKQGGANSASAYPKADPGASTMKLDPMSNTFKPGTRPPKLNASDLPFDQDPTIDDTPGRMTAVNNVWSKAKRDGFAPVHQMFPPFEAFLVNDISSTLERFPRKAPMTYHGPMDKAREEMETPRHMKKGGLATSGAGLGISLPGMPGYVENRATSPDDAISRTTSPPLTPGFQQAQPPFSYARAASKANLSELNAAERAKVKGKGKAIMGPGSNTDDGPSTRASSVDRIIQGDVKKDEDEWKAPEAWGEAGYKPKRDREGKEKAVSGSGGVEMKRGG